MLGSGWTRGLIGGAVGALLALLVPGAWLDGPGAASGAGAGVLRIVLVLLGFAAGYVAGARLFRPQDWQFDGADDGARPSAGPAVATSAAGPTDLDERLERIEKALASLPSQTTKAIKACPSADLDRTLRSIQRALRKPHSDPVLVEAVHALQSDGPAGLLARVEALETHLTERLAAIDARLAMLNVNETAAPMPPLRLRVRRPEGLAPKRVGQALADIRRSMDGVAH
jgi:hypothetical protein